MTRWVVFVSSLACSVESESHDRVLRLGKPFELFNLSVLVARSHLHLGLTTHTQALGQHKESSYLVGGQVVDQVRSDEVLPFAVKKAPRQSASGHILPSHRGHD